MAVERP